MSRRTRQSLAWLFVVVGLLGAGSPLFGQTPWATGDVAVGLNTGTVQVYGQDVLGNWFLKSEFQNVVIGARDVSFDADSFLVVTDEFGRQALRLDATGAVLATIENSITPPVGNTIIKSGNIAFDVDGVSPLIADLSRAGSTGTVHLYDPTGTLIDAASLPLAPSGSGAIGTGIFGFDVDVDGDGDLSATYATAAGGNWILRRKLFSTGAAEPLIQVGGSFNQAVRLLPEVIDGERSFLLARQLDIKYIAYDSVSGAYGIVRSYDVPSADNWETVSPAADGLSFWTGHGQAVYQFDLATGTTLTTIPGVVDAVNAFSEVASVAVAGAFRAAAAPPAPAPDLDNSIVETDRTVISSFGGLAALSLELLPLPGTPADLSGLDVQFQLTPAASGLLGPVTNTGNRYFADLTGAPGISSVFVTATVDGVPLNTAPVEITLVPMDPAQSTITVTPNTTVIGAPVVVIVTPRDDLGHPVGAGGNVVIGSSATQALTGVVDQGDGTYEQAFLTVIDGTESYTATYNGLEVAGSAQLQVVDPGNLGNFIGLTSAGGILDDYATLQEAIDRAADDGVTTIFVQPGDYAENVRIRGVSGLTLEALSTPTEPVIVNGFRFHGATDITVKGFQIDAMGRRHAALVRHDWAMPSSGITLENVTLANASWHGLTVRRGSSAITVEGSTVTGNGANGIAFGRETSDLAVRSSTLTNNGWDGIRVRRDSTGVEITDNTIDANGRHGIGIGRNVSDVLLSGNTITNSGRNGIDVLRDAAQLTISGNTVLDSDRTGVAIGRSGVDVVLSSNVIARSGREGVSVDRNTAILIDSNSISESGIDGNQRMGYAISFARFQSIPAELVTLIANVFTANNGRPQGSRSDTDIENYDGVIDATDAQPGYAP